MFKKLLPLLCVGLLLTGCTGSETEVKEDDPSVVHAMDTVMYLNVPGGSDALLREAGQLIHKLDAQISVTNEKSEIYALNRTGSTRLSVRPAAILGRTLELCEETGGALDVTIYPVVRAWGFTTDEYHVPAPEELDALLPLVDYHQVSLSPDGTVSIPEGVKVDLGSVAKGYTGDMVVDFLEEQGITSALLNLGGNVQSLGHKPDGSLWRVGIQDPDDLSGHLAVLETADEAVITSGGYERYFTGPDGTIYWHILDPETGVPAKNGLISVTIIGTEGLRCDALSTSLFVMGPEGAAEFWRAHQDFDMVLVKEDRDLIITPGIQDRFTLTAPDRNVEVLSYAEN